MLLGLRPCVGDVFIEATTLHCSKKQITINLLFELLFKFDLHCYGKRIDTFWPIGFAYKRILNNKQISQTGFFCRGRHIWYWWLLTLPQKRINITSTNKIDCDPLYFPLNPYLMPMSQWYVSTFSNILIHTSSIRRVTRIRHMHSRHFLSTLRIFVPLACMSQA